MVTAQEREREIFSDFRDACAKYEEEHPEAVLFCPTDQDHVTYGIWRNKFDFYWTKNLYWSRVLGKPKPEIDNHFILQWTIFLLEAAPEWITAQARANDFVSHVIKSVKNNTSYVLRGFIPSGYVAPEKSVRYAWLTDDAVAACWETEKKFWLNFYNHYKHNRFHNGLSWATEFVRKMNATSDRDLKGARSVIRALLDRDLQYGKTTPHYQKKLAGMLQNLHQEVQPKPEHEELVREEFSRHLQACQAKHEADLVATRTSKREARLAAKREADERVRKLLEMVDDLRKLNPRRDWQAWTERVAPTMKLIDAAIAYLEFKDADEDLAEAMRGLNLNRLREKLQEVEATRVREAEREQARLERERQERARARELRQHALQAMRENIARRCRQIVKVFNGIHDLDIDPDAVLNGEVAGEYASIHSASCTVGISLNQRLVLEQAMHCIAADRTWLEIEEGDEPDEMQATFDSANALIWHELCHLAVPEIIGDALTSSRLPDDKPETLSQARETAVDALAMRMGHRLYAHPAMGQDLPLADAERLRTMRHSLVALTRRVISHLAGKELEIRQHLFIARLMGQMAVHADDGSRLARNAYDALVEKFPVTAQDYAQHREAYATLYGYVLSTVDVASLKFLPELPQDEEAPRSASFSASHTLH